MSVSTEVRDRLAAEQARLVSALLVEGVAPRDFDAVRLRAGAMALRRKRARSAARAWPELAEALGEHFDERFTAYAAGSSLPPKGGSLADGRAFVRWLRAREMLPATFGLQTIAVDLRHSKVAEGLVPRRAPALEAAFLSSPRRLVVAVRLPWLGEHWLSIRTW